jgi:hypothetical protein
VPDRAGLLRRSSGSTELLLSRFGGFLLLAICIAHFTGATGVSRPENVDRADPIGVANSVLTSASATGKACSGRPATSHPPAAERPSASCANTSSSRRPLIDTHDSFAVGAILPRPKARGLRRVLVNPIDWHPDSGASPAANLGSVSSNGRSEPIPPPIPGLTGAWCDGGMLGVDVPPGQHRFRDLLMIAGIYHDFDYGLFYMNIRENAQTRIVAWRPQ